MNNAYYLPTETVCGRGCLREQGEKLKALGEHALIVTGRSSRQNGALADAQSALQANGQQYTVFDRVTPNPTVACVREGIALLRAAGADFIVAIGGGSPMDAAKAIALLSVQERTDEEIFAGGYEARALPMAHVPTTAGTGSEVTPYAILTNDFAQTKTSISCPALFPKLAFLDGSYTDNLPRDIAVNTALDALSHGVESLLSRTGNSLSEELAVKSIRMMFPLLNKISTGEAAAEDRDRALIASMFAGLAISVSGTTAVHGMGYYLTYFYGIDHGRANGLLLGETLRLCKEKELPQTDVILSACGLNSVGEFCDALEALLGEREKLPRGRLEEFARRVMENKNIKKSAYEPTEEEARRIYLKSFGHELYEL